MAAIGSVWGSGTWTDDVWALNTWADAVPPVIVIPVIPARVPYTPRTLPRDYNAGQLGVIVGALARSVAPQITRNVSAATSITTADGTLLCDTSGGNFAVTLPVPQQVQFLAVNIVNVGSGVLTITGTVSGSVNPTLAQWKAVTAQSDGAIWIKVAEVA